jgi:ribonuclease T2
VNQILPRAQISLGGLRRGVPQQQPNLLKLAPLTRRNFAPVRRRSCGALPGTSAASAHGSMNCQTTFSDRTSPGTWLARFTGRNTHPSGMAAADVHTSTVRRAYRRRVRFFGLRYLLAVSIQRVRLRWSSLAAVLICLLAFTTVNARSRRKKSQTGDTTFSYYLLSLSYAPDFCAQSTGNKYARECGVGHHVGFVVHGLWPQEENGRGPQNCRSTGPVSQDIVRSTLGYIPSESLIQHEWTTHGSCTGLDAAEYFALVRRARDMIKVPDELTEPSKQVQLRSVEIQAEFAVANPSFPKAAFRVSCYRNAELEEVRLCLNKDLSPRVCSASAVGCTAGTLSLRPVR